MTKETDKPRRAFTPTNTADNYEFYVINQGRVIYNRLCVSMISFQKTQYI